MRDTVLPYFNGPVDGQGESDTNNCNLAGHGRCFSGWGRLLIDLKYFGFFGEVGWDYCPPISVRTWIAPTTAGFGV
jgi:hypothetical protein